MIRHGPCPLTGPVRKDAEWWGDQEPAGSAAADPRSPLPAEPQGEEQPIRKELVERVRREIAEGTYDTPEKWEAALDRLFKRLEESE